MAESQNTVERIADEMDEMLTGVMPESCAGHGRLTISERDLSPDQRAFAQKLFGRLVEKHPNVDAAKLAEKSIEKAQDEI